MIAIPGVDNNPLIPDKAFGIAYGDTTGELLISTTHSGSLAIPQINRKRAASGRFHKLFRKKANRRRAVRFGLIAANALVLVAVIAFVFNTSHGSGTVSSSAAVLETAGKSSAANPVDKLTSYDIAANMAKLTQLPEQTAIANQAQTAKVTMSLSSGSDDVAVSKPQIVATALKSRQDITSYTTVAGDTIASVAQKFGVTSDSIKWSNNIAGANLSAGTKLTIPPLSGIVYTVKAGDTVQSLASKYKANADQITAYNDAEIRGLVAGEQIIIPNGQIVQVAAVSTSSMSSSLLTTVYGGNGYDPGYCTWYAFNRRAQIGRPIGSNWGNASSWAAYAASAGYRVDHTPEVGAVMQNGGGLGHVAVVETVNDDGSWTVSEMNYAGFNRISSRTLPASAAGSYNFIH